MIAALQAFHFLRPWWLLALLPAAVLAYACLRGKASAGGWAKVIDRELLDALLLPHATRRSALPFGLLLAGWSLAVMGLAGPAWERLPEPVHRRGDALVVALDMGGSMLAGDISPSRLARARFKLNDVLARRRDAYTALLVYAGDAHVVTPLSDDTGTVAAMLPALDPGIMPVPGNDPVAAVRLALSLLRGAGVSEGRVLLVTDSFTDTDARPIASLLDGSGVSLAVLGVGTRDGAPVPLDGGGFARDASGGIAIPRLDADGMRAAAAIAGAAFREISVDDADIDALLPESFAQQTDPRSSGSRVYDQWRDRAPWVALFLLPLAALGMRRGWLLLLPLCLCLPAPRAQALEWQDLWLRKDQQAAQALASGDAARAAELFRDPQWKGSAQYQAGNWAEAARSFAGSQGPDADYNRGNALARQGKLEDALAAYDAALAHAPGMEDARANRKLVEDLLRQQNAGKSGADDRGKQGAAQQQDQQGNNGSQRSQGDKQNGSGAQPDGAGQQSPQEGPANPSDADAGNSGKKAGSPDAGKGDPGESAKAASPRDGTNSGDNGQGSAGSTPQSAGETKDGKKPPENDAMAGAAEGKAGEEDQAVEQWLRQVPDDPGALLRRKFEYEAARRAGGNGQ